MNTTSAIILDDDAIISQALATLPEKTRAEYLAAAWLKLKALVDGSAAEKIVKLASHLKYLRMRDRQQYAIDASTPAPTTITALELRDEIASLSIKDQGIVSLIIAGFTVDEIAAVLGSSAATISRRMQRIRESADAN